MQEFVLREIFTDEIKPEIDYIGFDNSYSQNVCGKYKYKNIKIYGLSCAQANIIKQTALSVGADCAAHREVITGNVKKSDLILGGSTSQIKKIAEKLKFQPFGLKFLGEKLLLEQTLMNKTKIMGILNLTDNSFSDGGDFLNPEKAYAHLKQMLNDGADIIDIGAESTKPYSQPVTSKTQLERILPLMKMINEEGLKVPISIDTRNAKVAEKCIQLGASIINDVSGLDYDEKMADVIANTGVKIIIQHSKGTPENMQNSPNYENLLDEIFLNLYKKINFAVSKGILKDKITIDPGIGFGKTRIQNYEIIKRINELRTLNCPILLGISRKSLLNMPDEENYTKDIYSLALNTLAIERHVDIIRVHNVKLHNKLNELMDYWK